MPTLLDVSLDTPPKLTETLPVAAFRMGRSTVERLTGSIIERNGPEL
ncbi:hypothetical protein BJG93_36790 (plasmid) [Paraburkholderia sprentiae WSM5005]|uniref:Uncharacterized protein n=1 Tax=Paraburkholderia sprentiae WSM5005 TaxID=754502 RepID=A0A8F4KHX8_9BURK|nr:hypothetical protein BJG93_36790 [Paraburkholderia sprentiae WSM5005]